MAAPTYFTAKPEVKSAGDYKTLQITTLAMWGNTGPSNDRTVSHLKKTVEC